MGAMLKEMFPDTVMHQDFVWHWCANEGSDCPSSGCECNTMMRYGWTGNQTLQAPNPAEDPDFSKWTIVDARFEDTPVIPCNHHKLGGVLPFPLANERICQCLDSTTLALFNAGLQATIGGPDVPGQTLFNMTNPRITTTRRTSITSESSTERRRRRRTRRTIQRTMAPKHPTNPTSDVDPPP